MSTVLSRDFLKPPYNYEIVVVRMKAPTFTDTQHGVPPYADAQVRFWSICSDEPKTTGVVRCTPDNLAVNVNGFVTFVISDRARRPPDAVLNQWGAVWIPWGALGAGEVVYDIDDNPLSNADGVFYENVILYRQTMANAAFAESIRNVSQLPVSQWKAAMGDYFPSAGYCTIASFQASGAGCVTRRP